MTADRVSEEEASSKAGADSQTTFSSQAAEVLLRQVAALRSSSAADDQLTQLIRIVDSATWSVPVPMTVLVDGTLLRGVLVPGEVSATFLDGVLRRTAHAAVDQLASAVDESDEGQPGDSADNEATAATLQHARAFLRRISRRPFSAMQVSVRQRNAKALMAINRWHGQRDPDSHLTPLDFPGSYADPAAVIRDVLPYTTGQRALTLANVKMLAGGEWLAIPTPIRIVIGRIGAWTVDL